MSISPIDNERGVWGALSTAPATVLGKKNAASGFADALEQAATSSAVGFGVRGETGQVAGSIVTSSPVSEELLRQLQSSILTGFKAADINGGLDSRLNGSLFL
ncbi:MAG: hypothetical protein LBS31_10270 [Candidatus Adiutrix sp.]|jgi:hypothetical protein|nr:hypothetical protein [Candidatus Adiutrix sp.]